MAASGGSRATAPLVMLKRRIALPAVMIAASTGVRQFFVQHQLEETHWARHNEWNANVAAVNGSSYYDLPGPLRWLTGNIGIHHIHHLASRIPFYRLPDALEKHPQLAEASRVTMLASLRCAHLALWDEWGCGLVSFEETTRL